MCIYWDVRIVEPFTYESRKIGSVIYFLLKKMGLIIYLAALKKGAIWHTHPYYTIYRNPGYYTNITVNSCNTKRISSLEKSLSEKYVHMPGCQKTGPFTQESRKIGPFIYFLLKKGGQSYTWQRCTDIRTMPYIGSYPPPTPPPELCLQ